jgi:photosystem II stability/assembly factor-like uncharacterized protein
MKSQANWTHQYSDRALNHQNLNEINREGDERRRGSVFSTTDRGITIERNHAQNDKVLTRQLLPDVSPSVVPKIVPLY